MRLALVFLLLQGLQASFVAFYRVDIDEDALVAAFHELNRTSPDSLVEHSRYLRGLPAFRSDEFSEVDNGGWAAAGKLTGSGLGLLASVWQARAAVRLQRAALLRRGYGHATKSVVQAMQAELDQLSMQYALVAGDMDRRISDAVRDVGVRLASYLPPFYIMWSATQTASDHNAIWKRFTKKQLEPPFKVDGTDTTLKALDKPMLVLSDKPVATSKAEKKAATTDLLKAWTALLMDDYDRIQARTVLGDVPSLDVDAGATLPLPPRTDSAWCLSRPPCVCWPLGAWPLTASAPPPRLPLCALAPHCSPLHSSLPGRPLQRRTRAWWTLRACTPSSAWPWAAPARRAAAAWAAAPSAWRPCCGCVRSLRAQLRDERVRAPLSPRDSGRHSHSRSTRCSPTLPRFA